MVLAIRVHHTGGPDVMVAEDIDLAPPLAGEVRVRHKAIGVNYIDTYFRSGLYKTTLPFSPGNEAAGIIEAVGEGVDVDGFKPGDRVVYLHGPGAYVEARNVPADKLIQVPDTVSDEVAAASLLKGLTVQYLLRRTFEVNLGAGIIGTAGSQAKVDLALAHGYDHVINYADEDFAPKALKLNGGRLDVVYDSVGADTFPASLDVLKPRGLFVSFGQSSGPIPPFDIGILNAKGSLYMTRPSLFAYNATREDLLASVAELFDLIGRGIITIPIHQRFALKDAAKAHEALESRATTGTTILVP
jgi:NADPH:quinone reductase